MPREQIFRVMSPGSKACEARPYGCIVLLFCLRADRVVCPYGCIVMVTGRQSRLPLQLYRFRLKIEEGFGAGVLGVGAEEFFDSYQLIVFGHSVGSGGGSGFYLTGIYRHHQIRYGYIFSFA